MREVQLVDDLPDDREKCEACGQPMDEGSYHMDGDGVAWHKEGWLDICAPAARARRPLLATADHVNHPSHYTMGGIEVLDAIEAWELGFHRGNAVKYVARAGRKPGSDELQDLQKARFYLQREIERVAAAAGRPSEGAPLDLAELANEAVMALSAEVLRLRRRNRHLKSQLEPDAEDLP